MTTKVERAIEVDAPLRTVYDQWTQLEAFPRFMSGVKKVIQLSDDRLEWVADLAGVRRQWIAKILEQVPDRKVAWTAVEGATNAGAAEFSEISPTRTQVHLCLEYAPELPRRAIVDPPDEGLIGTIPVGMPTEPGDRGLLSTDAAAGFGDPESEREPGVIETREPDR